MKKRPEVRRSRLRLLRPAGVEGGAWDPPVLSVSPRFLRRVDADGRTTTALTIAREELWARGDGLRLRATIDEADKLRVVIERDGAEPIVLERLVRIPGARSATNPYLGRWEYAKHRVVITPKGAGAIAATGDPSTLESFGADREPEIVHVYEGEGVRLALRDVPNGARVVCADGVPGLEVDGFVSDISVPDLEHGPHVEIPANEAFLRGFPAVGLRASFGGLDFAAFAPSQGDGSAELARFTKKQYGLDRGALRPIERPDDEDAVLAARLAEELAPSPVTGRVLRGKPGTITLSDGRRYRVHSALRERLPKGETELVVGLLLDGVLLATLSVAHEGWSAPDANTVLTRLQTFLLGLHAEPAA
ncbi:MAG: hypothetical protein R3B82_26530 [Sandaracinaceae bacterium]